MSHPKEIDLLEEKLRRLPYVDDTGFTDRVMARLPARRAPRWPLVGSAMVAAGIATFTLPALVTEALSAATRVSAMPPYAVVAAGAVLVILSAAALGRLLWE